MSNLPELAEGEVYWLNSYKCPDCGTEWDDVWSCQVDDQCPECGLKAIGPEKSEEWEGEL